MSFICGNVVTSVLGHIFSCENDLSLISTNSSLPLNLDFDFYRLVWLSIFLSLFIPILKTRMNVGYEWCGNVAIKVVSCVCLRVECISRQSWQKVIIQPIIDNEITFYLIVQKVLFIYLDS